MTNSQFIPIFGKSQNASSNFLDTTNFGSSLNCAIKSHEQRPIQPSSKLLNNWLNENITISQKPKSMDTTMLIRPM